MQRRPCTLAALARDATVAELHAGEAVLDRTEIELPARKAKYLRVSWPESLRRIELSTVTAVFASVAAPAERQWIEIRGSRCGGEPYCFDFDSGGQRVVDRPGSSSRQATWCCAAACNPRLRPTSLAHAALRRPLQPQARRRPSGKRARRPASVSDRYWRLAPEGGSTGDPATAPTLVLGWTPHRLRFVAQGEPPYTVAFGSASSSSATRPFLGTLEEKKLEGLTVAATASEVFTLGGEDGAAPRHGVPGCCGGCSSAVSPCSAGWCCAWFVSSAPRLGASNDPDGPGTSRP